MNCKSPPAAVLCGYHCLESLPLWIRQNICDNYTHCDILGWVGVFVSDAQLHTFLLSILLHCWAFGNAVNHHHGGKEWVSPTMFPKSLSSSCPFPPPLSTSQMESISLTCFHALQVKIGPDRLTCHSRAIRPQLLNQNHILSSLIHDKPARNIFIYITHVLKQNVDSS